MKWGKAVAVLLVLALVGGCAWLLYALGGSREQTTSAKQATATVQQAQKKADDKTRTDLARASATGRAREADRAALDSLFNKLAKEAADAPSAAVDHYVLPDDRLRVWRAANAGPGADPGEAGGEPDGGAAATAAAGDRPHPGPGGEPRAGGAGLSPAGFAGLPPAGVPAGSN
ncbi:MAG: hypothetical protein ACLGJD_05510 [Gammaproteobacteria bacterium]